jgi:hypothetical protein
MSDETVSIRLGRHNLPSSGFVARSTTSAVVSLMALWSRGILQPDDGLRVQWYLECARVGPRVVSSHPATASTRVGERPIGNF